MRTQVSTRESRKRPLARTTNGRIQTLSKRLAKVEAEITLVRQELAKGLELAAKRQNELRRDPLADI